jgi:hypothetical protein
MGSCGSNLDFIKIPMKPFYVHISQEVVQIFLRIYSTWIISCEQKICDSLGGSA